MKAELNGEKPLVLDEDRQRMKDRPATVGTVIGLVCVFSLLFSVIVVGSVYYFFPSFVNPGSSSSVTLEPGRTAVIEYKDNTEATIEAVKKVRPSVVSIIGEKDLSALYQLNNNGNSFLFGDPFSEGLDFNKLFQIQGQNQQTIPKGLQPVLGGTGIIISDTGLILTNKHVVSDTEATYKVFLEDGRSFDATIVDEDTVNDLAVIRITAEALPVAELGTSKELEIGETVLAIGNSLSEYTNSVTKGIISGIGRTIVAAGGGGEQIERLEGVIQTDAAINLGNSGGPLIDLSGKVIGINTAIDRNGQAVGFAIPIDDAKVVIDTVMKYGKIVRPQLGVRYILINKVVKEANNLPVDHGAVVIRGENESDLAVVPGGPADKAGIVENDIILEVNGVPVDEANSLVRLVQNYAPGDEIELTILHKGEQTTAKVTLGSTNTM